MNVYTLVFTNTFRVSLFIELNLPRLLDTDGNAFLTSMRGYVATGLWRLGDFGSPALLLVDGFENPFLPNASVKFNVGGVLCDGDVIFTRYRYYKPTSVSLSLDDLRSWYAALPPKKELLTQDERDSIWDLWAGIAPPIDGILSEQTRLVRSHLDKTLWYLVKHFAPNVAFIKSVRE